MGASTTLPCRLDLLLGPLHPLGGAVGLLAGPVRGELGRLRTAAGVGRGFFGRFGHLAQRLRFVAGTLQLRLGHLDETADALRLPLLAGPLGRLTVLTLLPFALGLPFGLRSMSF